MFIINKALRIKVASITLCLVLVFAPIVKAEEFVILGNGSGSENTETIQLSQATVVQQTNAYEISNEVKVTSETGNNSASENTDSVVSIETGSIDAQISVNNNTNSSQLEIGCCPKESNSVISGNGTDSQNSTFLDSSTTNRTLINQSATIQNNITGYASTGGNTANENGGDVILSTGSIRVLGSINNAPVNFSTVKIANGDVNLSTRISGNGADSESEIAANLNSDADVFTNSVTTIDNFTRWDLITGGNRVNKNVGGVKVKTGNIDLLFFIENFANIGRVEISCCPSISDPGNTGNEKPLEEETKPVEKGSSQIEKREEGKGGSILPSAAAIEAGGSGLMGLSDTSSGQLNALLFFVGLAFFAYGGKILTGELLPKSTRVRV